MGDMVVKILQFLVSQPFITIGEVNDTTIGKTMLENIMLHDVVVLMSVNANVDIIIETKVHDVLENTVNLGLRCYVPLQ